jgi:hypothetical protein
MDRAQDATLTDQGSIRSGRATRAMAWALHYNTPARFVAAGGEKRTAFVLRTYVVPRWRQTRGAGG